MTDTAIDTELYFVEVVDNELATIHSRTNSKTLDEAGVYATQLLPLLSLRYSVRIVDGDGDDV